MQKRWATVVAVAGPSQSAGSLHTAASRPRRCLGVWHRGFFEGADLGEGLVAVAGEQSFAGFDAFGVAGEMGLGLVDVDLGRRE